MKNSKRILAALLKMIDIECFYSIDINQYNVNLQAKFHSNIVKFALSHKFHESAISENGYVHFKRGCIDITLTE